MVPVNPGEVHQWLNSKPVQIVESRCWNKSAFFFFSKKSTFTFLRRPWSWKQLWYCPWLQWPENELLASKIQNELLASTRGLVQQPQSLVVLKSRANTHVQEKKKKRGKIQPAAFKPFNSSRLSSLDPPPAQLEKPNPPRRPDFCLHSSPGCSCLCVSLHLSSFQVLQDLSAECTHSRDYCRIKWRTKEIPTGLHQPYRFFFKLQKINLSQLHNRQYTAFPTAYSGWGQRHDDGGKPAHTKSESHPETRKLLTPVLAPSNELCDGLFLWGSISHQMF